MKPTKELIDDTFRQKVLRARQLTPDERFRAGPELFRMACEWAKWGIRDQHPDADEAEVSAILKQRLALRRRLESIRVPLSVDQRSEGTLPPE